MPQDRRTKKFKQDREDRILNRKLDVQFTEDQIIQAPRIHQELPDNCIWCGFILDGLKAVCPVCHNCQSCGMLNAAGGLEFCYLCGNKVPDSKVPETVPEFVVTPPGQPMRKHKRESPGFRLRNRGKRPGTGKA